MKFDIYKLTEKNTEIEVNTEKKLSELKLDFLFNYEIFPKNILTFKTQ